MLNLNLASLLVFCAILFFLLGLHIAIRDKIAYRGRIGTRLTPASEDRIFSEAELSDIRQRRSLTREGHYATPLIYLNKLILQSGARIGLSGVALSALACAAAAGCIAFLAGAGAFLCALAAVATGVGLPIVVLRAMRDGRQRRFEEQLPEAIDTIVRSLKAGHALSLAIVTVSRHLPDPIAAEFKVTAAEMSYGLDLETAMVNLHTRVGQADLGLLALSVSIQSQTGGNLAEILSSMARIIRERFKLRRKAHALASEARVSAYVLTALPVLLLGVLWLISPGYYGDIWGMDYVKPVLGGAAVWMLLGDYVMYRMSRIRV